MDRALDADARRRAAVAEADNLRAEQKSLGKLVGKAAGEEKAQLLARGKELAEQVKAAVAAQNEADEEAHTVQRALSNIVAGAPAGGEDDFVLLETVGQPRDIADPKDHLELGESLGLIDMERGAKVSGSRFYFLTGNGALLQLGLLNLAAQMAVRNGFELMIPPVLVRPEIMGGTGFLGAHADEVYHLPDDDLYLVGTSEVPLAGYHSNEIIDLSDGPKRYAGWSSCFRREAGSYGKTHPRHHPRAPVRQGRGLRLLPTGGGPGRAPAAARVGARDARRHRRALPGHRHCRRRPGQLGCPQVRLRGVGAHPADLPRVDLDVELHDLPGAPPLDPLPRRERQAADRRNSQRHAGDHPVDRRDPREPPAAGWFGGPSSGVGGKRRPRSPRAQAMSIRTCALLAVVPALIAAAMALLPWVSLEDRGVPMRWSGLGFYLGDDIGTIPAIVPLGWAVVVVAFEALSVLGLALFATGGQWQSAIRWFFFDWRRSRRQSS